MVLQFLKALAHESRLRLLGLVAAREHSVQELAAGVALKEPTVSHHLAMLREAGLVTLRQDGNTHWYGLNQKALSRLSRAVFARDQLAAFARRRDQRRRPRRAQLPDAGRPPEGFPGHAKEAPPHPRLARQAIRGRPQLSGIGSE